MMIDVLMEISDETERQHTPGEYVPEDTQCIITIGGDGTLIQAARDWQAGISPCLDQQGTFGLFKPGGPHRGY